MKVRGWFALVALALLIVLAGCSREDPSIIAALPEEAPDRPTNGEQVAMTVQVDADPAAIDFVQDTLQGPADQPFTVNFNNPSAVEHNWVMVEPGTEAAVAEAAQAQGGDPTGVEGVIAGHDPIVNSSVTVDVPAQPAGTYPYICTVPGHYQAGMVGEITLGAVATNGGSPAPDGAAAVSADPVAIRFQEETMVVPANQPVTVTFNNPSAVPHNWVLVEPDQAQDVADQSTTQGGDPTAVAGVIAGHRPITNDSATVEVRPLEPGTYEYICTVPGHYQAGMRGTLTAQ
jgi:uncharacterized cupredoxin-like copper-binding protein